MDDLRKTIFLSLIIILIIGCIKEPSLKTELNSNQTLSKEDLKIINLSAQQLILGDNETREILGFDWKKVYQGTNKNPALNASNEIFLTYGKGPINETKIGEDTSFFDSYLLVFPDINETKKFVFTQVFLEHFSA